MENLEREIEEKANEIVNVKKVDEIADNAKINFQIDTSKSYDEQASELVGVMATQHAINDAELVNDITENKKQELKHNAEAHLKDKKAESKKADIKLQEADYGVFSGVATYAGIKKPLPLKMQKILFTILSAIQTLWLLLIGTITSIATITCDCCDSVVKKIGSIAKSARVLVLSALSLGGIALTIYVIISLLQKYNVIGQVI